MTFNFHPKTDEEIERMHLLPDGTYRFTVRNALETVSKEKGNPMVRVDLEIYGHDGGSSLMSDYLVASDKMAWKIKHFCDTLGLLEQYQKGNLEAQNLIRLEGYAQVVTEKRSEYPARNKVKDYGKPKSTKTNSILSPTKPDPNQSLEQNDDSDLPF
jgi:hypothetical protein